jgi:hypothetical protein
MNINNAAYYQIIQRIGHLVSEFGSVWKLMLAISRNPIKLKVLVDYGSDALLLNAHNSELDLRVPSLGAPAETIIQPEYPYEVFSIEGELLYRVSSHGGVFGSSSLDQRLLLGSNTGDIYFLRYQSLGGPFQKALMIDRRLIPKGEDQQVPNTKSLAKNNLIIFQSRDELEVYPDLSLYFLRQEAMLQPTVSSLIGNPQASKTTFSALPYSFVTEFSGWICLTVGQRAVPFVGIEGIGKYRLIPVGLGLYYLTMEVDPSSTYQRLRPSYLNRPAEEGLNLRVTLSPDDFANISYDFTQDTSIQT